MDQLKENLYIHRKKYFTLIEGDCDNCYFVRECNARNDKDFDCSEVLPPTELRVWAEHIDIREKFKEMRGKRYAKNQKS